MEKLNVLVFLSTVRQERLADRILKLVNSQLLEFGFELTLIDPIVENLEMVSVPYHYYINSNDPPIKLRELNKRISSADAFVIISAEYNWTIPPALSNVIDHFSPVVFKYKPVSIVSYSSGQGGNVACSHILTMMTSMGAAVQPMFVNITMAESNVTLDGKTKNHELIEGLKLMCEQLQFSGWAYKNQKKIKNPPNINLFF